MRFSLQSLAIGLVSSQARLALASPCKPLTTTTLAATTTTAAVEEASTTTAISEGSTTTVEGQTTIVTLSEATTTTALSDLSTTLTTLTLGEASTTTAIVEESTTTTLGEESTTTALTEEPTTTTFEATTTTAAETTTTTEAPEGTQMAAVFADNTEKDTYLDKWGGTYSTPQSGGSTSKARFELEPETNRLFTYLIDGTKVYLFTVIPDGPNYAFQFDTAANIDSTTVYHYVLCTADADNVLSCASESGPTPIVWYWVDSAARYYGNSNPTFDSSPVVHFKLG
ncbi:hypothetical protein FOXG_07403 [Fusarium oxysporum f. sp. lycopersici 4287]|uniref:Uncharacterized protein n=3 Tax=Fusarium oxysporum TaxID=5507 RepID=A0A0J9V1J6_FUSO4|nr:hypothetical protein FOXG_07403 [Fusarium oxysporum f. sp. lycopersici 4287]EXK46265.1 hypothetical protein FOMG_04471 [Fusarium oxysporum f. sp. melonis 26406]KAJ9426044.1 hypothetical protein QL093DRAFT_2076394 [Fusarium oxysporum]KNB05033.1 hypothetical protein FOXG_07403 [Fusarium oxysporum f. sp. lycopersici 4287]